MHSKITIVCGPTASGKSARAIDIAKSSDGVIINADAMQVYRELRVITARPTAEQERVVPHKLYGVVSVREAFSVSKWLALVKTAIDETLAAGKKPIITGGTGLYIKALMEGLSPIPDVPEEIRTQATTLWEEQGSEVLKARDPIMSAQLKDGDMQRHIRALEVILATGKSLSYWQEVPRVKLYPDAEFEIEYIDVAREILYERCDARFMAMMEMGALEEVKAVHAMKLDSKIPAMRIVGVPELINYLEGAYSLDEAIIKAQQATRNYAKRQITWFKHQL